MKTLRLLAACFAITLLAGCIDNPTGPVVPEGPSLNEELCAEGGPEVCGDIGSDN